MKEKIAYFFGSGTEVEFSLFTPAHILPVVWMIAMILQIVFGIIGGIWCFASAFSGGVAGVPLLLFVGIAALLSVLPSFFQR